MLSCRTYCFHAEISIDILIGNEASKANVLESMSKDIKIYKKKLTTNLRLIATDENKP